jgi:hypothetical protein
MNRERKNDANGRKSVAPPSNDANLGMLRCGKTEQGSL